MKLQLKLYSLLIVVSFWTSAQQKELTFESLFTNREFYGSSLSGVQWKPDGSGYTFLRYSPQEAVYKIYDYNIQTGEESVLLSGKDLSPGGEEETFRIQNYKWFPDGRKILFTGTVPARSVKSGGTFYIYDLETNKFENIIHSEQPQLNALISPDGLKLGYVKDNDLYSMDISSGKETRLTFDGSDVILNGVFDWVYEEEFSIIVGWEWAPDSRTIAYWRLDQSNVPELDIAVWDSLYMTSMKMRYPKPGAPNSIVKIGVVDIESAKTIWMNIGDETDIYIPRIKFTGDPEKLSIQRLNRLQNKLELLIANTATGSSEVIITETSSAWLEVVDELHFLKNGKQFIWSSERDGYKHLYLYDMTGKLVNQITKGNWELKLLKRVDEDSRKIYFTANERGTVYSDFYYINYDGSGLKRITDRAGTHTADISPRADYFIDRYSNSNQLTSTSIYNTEGVKIRDIITPKMDFFTDYNFSPVEYLKFKTSDGVELNASIIKPYNYDPGRRYPVLFNVYGGPGSEHVIDQWNGFDFLFHQYLVKQGYVVFNLDNRGTGNRGTEFRHIVYKDLGRWEVHDMIEGAKYLINEGIADPERIGIWGWSYGGYTAAITILLAADYFKTAVAIASVTDWRFYDNIYTERFMQTPELNPEGYSESSTLTHAGKLKGNLLLIHGTADDNVHFQNTVKLTEELIAENKQFDVMFYPEKNHGIYGGMTRMQLFRKILNYVLEKL